MKYPERILGVKAFVYPSKALDDFHAEHTEHETVVVEDKSIFADKNAVKTALAIRYNKMEAYYVLYPDENRYMKKILRGVNPDIIEDGNLDSLLNINPYSVSDSYLREFASKFDFLDATVANMSNFTYEGMDGDDHKFTSIVYLEFDGKEETEKSTFHVNLDKNFNLVERYNLLHSNGSEYGFPIEDPPENKSKLKM